MAIVEVAVVEAETSECMECPPKKKMAVVER